MAILTVRSLDNKLLEEKFKRFASDHMWIKENYPEFIKKYPEKYIAVLNKTVEYDSADLRDLINTISKNGKNVNNYAVALITAKPRSCLY